MTFTRAGADRKPASIVARARADPDLRAEIAFWGVTVVLGCILSWGSQYHPTMMPFWAPWEFSWFWFLATASALWWYGRGVIVSPKQERPPIWRSICYVAGVFAIYSVLQTHFEYLAEHMFFLNRVQHTVMHHVGPFLIAVAWPGAAIRRGMPPALRQATDAPALHRIVRVVQNPAIASFLFVGLLGFWLIPPVHFHAMLNPRLYQVMNWSMVVDGILFWVLVLDPRPKPPALVSFPARLTIAVAVMFPQVFIGVPLSFSKRDLYVFYDVCGRVYPSISALTDQQMGGLIVWLPAVMMSVLAAMLVLKSFLQEHEKAG